MNSELQRVISKSFSLLKEKSFISYECLENDEYLIVRHEDFLNSNEYTSAGSLLIFYFAILCSLFSSGSFLTHYPELFEMVKTVFDLSRQENITAEKKFLIEAMKKGLFDYFLDDQKGKFISEKSLIREFVIEQRREIQPISWMEFVAPVFEVLAMKYGNDDFDEEMIERKIKLFYLELFK